MIQSEPISWLVKVIIIQLIGSALLYAQPNTLWTKSYGGNSDDYGHSVIQTSDGGFVIAGDYNANYLSNIGDIYLIKTDQNGDTVWTKTYGGQLGDYSLSVLQTSDGGFALTGYTHSFGSFTRSALLLKTDSTGNMLWLKTYGINNYNACHSIHLTSDEGFILAGETSISGTSNDCYVIRTDSNGDTIWAKTYGGPNTEWADDAFQMPDGGFIISGTTNSYGTGGFDAYLIRIDINGDTLWTKTYGGPEDDWTASANITSDNGLLITGATSSFGNGQEDIFLLRTDHNGDTLWIRTYGGSGTDWALSAYQISGGGFIVIGRTNSFGAGSNDLYLLRIDSNGDSLWAQTYGDTGDESGSSVKQTSDEGFILTGHTSSFGSGGRDVYLIRLLPDSTVGIFGSNEIYPDGFFLYQNYPNPFNPTTKIEYSIPEMSKITLTVINPVGEKITTLVDETKDAGNYEVIWSAKGIPNGVYFYRLQTGDFVKTKKMILLK